MIAKIKFQSSKQGEIDSFLSKFFNTTIELGKEKKWVKNYKNPIEISDIIGAFIDNKEDFDIKLWISLDKDVFININETNANDIIKYLFERYPY